MFVVYLSVDESITVFFYLICKAVDSQSVNLCFQSSMIYRICSVVSIFLSLRSVVSLVSRMVLIT